MGKVYYFAYGLNLSRKVMEQKAPGHQVYGLAYLADYRLVFNAGKGLPSTENLEPAQGEKVYGLVYELRATDWENLDRIEQDIYRREKKTVYIPGIQNQYSIWTYTATCTQDNLPPLLSHVYKIYSAARIIPGYQPRHLQQLEALILSLKA